MTNDRRGVENTDFPSFSLPFFCLWLCHTCRLPPSMGLWLIAAVRNNNRGNGGVSLWRAAQTATWLRGYEVTACDVLAGHGAIKSFEGLLHPSCPTDIRKTAKLNAEFMYIVLYNLIPGPHSRQIKAVMARLVDSDSEMDQACGFLQFWDGL